MSHDQIKNMAYWRKKNTIDDSPVKHTTNRSTKMMKKTVDGQRLRIGTHEEKYGKGHDNSAHPNYWKKEKGQSSWDGDTDKEREINLGLDLKEEKEMSERGKKITEASRKNTSTPFKMKGFPLQQGISSPVKHLGSGTTGPNQKNHHQPYGPEGPIKGKSYPAVMPRPAGDPVHKPGENPNSKKKKNKGDGGKKKEKKKTTDPLNDGTYSPY